MSTAQPATPKRKSAVRWWGFGKKSEPEGEVDKKDESFYRAGKWQLVWWKFRRHKLAQLAMVVLGIFYLIVIFDEFISPYDPQKRFKVYSSMAPPSIHISDAQGNFHPPL